jgi:UDP-2,3-diacylglucosamine hydrolase
MSAGVIGFPDTIEQRNLRFRDKGTHLYFASDLHLGVPNREESLRREKNFIRWLNHVKDDAAAIFIVGDLFDFWFEYTYTVPKYYTRLFGKIASLTDSGLPVYLFTGNHDMWMFGYLKEELGVEIFEDPIRFSFRNKLFEVGHGDGLGPGDRGYKFLKKVFRSRLNQWLFARLHPNLSFGMANYWSKRSRLSNNDSMTFEKEKEFIYLYCRHAIKKNPQDYYVFGHRHLMIDTRIDDTPHRYINLGEWFNTKSYGVFDGDFRLEIFP